MTADQIVAVIIAGFLFAGLGFRLAGMETSGEVNAPPHTPWKMVRPKWRKRIAGLAVLTGGFLLAAGWIPLILRMS